MSEARKINPLIALAAVSVTLFSLVGIGVMTGMMPSSFSKNSDSSLETGASKAVDAKTGATPATVARTQTRREPARQPAQQAAVAPKAAPACTSCGVVASVNAITLKGEGSGLGAVAGGVLGGVLGNQVGGGSGKKIATVAGAAGGAYAGHQVEKNMKSTTRHDVVVNMDDGSTRTFSYDTQPAFQAGSKVRVVNGTLTPD
ncbi:MAG: glycine zipper 2TM domain-containing protein [Burkholderiales bacterium]